MTDSFPDSPSSYSHRKKDNIPPARDSKSVAAVLRILLQNMQYGYRNILLSRAVYLLKSRCLRAISLHEVTSQQDADYD